MAGGVTDRAGSEWRGWSSRVYAMTVHPLSARALSDAGRVVALAVERSDKAVPRIVLATAFRAGMPTPSPAAWIDAAQSKGANELHLYQPEKANADLIAVANDLGEG